LTHHQKSGLKFFVNGSKIAQRGLKLEGHGDLVLTQLGESLVLVGEEDPAGLLLVQLDFQVVLGQFGLPHPFQQLLVLLFERVDFLQQGVVHVVQLFLKLQGHAGYGGSVVRPAALLQQHVEYSPDVGTHEVFVFTLPEGLLHAFVESDGIHEEQLVDAVCSLSAYAEFGEGIAVALLASQRGRAVALHEGAWHIGLLCFSQKVFDPAFDEAWIHGDVAFFVLDVFLDVSFHSDF